MATTLEVLAGMADHIEMEHERELTNTVEAPIGWTLQRLTEMHAEMHRHREDWGHSHKSSRSEP